MGGSIKKVMYVHYYFVKRASVPQLRADAGCSLEDLPIEKGGGRGSGISVLLARHHDDADLYEL